MPTYEIQRTAPTVYLNQTGDAVNGFKVTIYFPDYDETHFLNVASLDPETVQSEADKLYDQRQALRSLGRADEESE